MKTKKILQLPALILALALAGTPRSQAVTYTWNTDTSTAFDVVITGTGPWIDTLNSPNGLWSVGAHAGFAADNPMPGECSISDGGGKTTFLGTINGIYHPYEYLEGYDDFFPEIAPVHDGDSFELGNSPRLPWQGSAPITITSMPNPHDASTWTWTEEISGQVLAVPEP